MTAVRFEENLNFLGILRLRGGAIADFVSITTVSRLLFSEGNLLPLPLLQAVPFYRILPSLYPTKAQTLYKPKL